MGVSPPPAHVTAVTCDPPLQAILPDYTFLTLYDMLLSELYGKMALQNPYWGPDPGPEPPLGRPALRADQTRATPDQTLAARALRT